METFNLQHTVLYAKGWYKRYDPKSTRKTIWDDLQITLEADGYLGCFEGDSEAQIKNRIATLIVYQFERIPKEGSVGTLGDFYEGIKEYNCWKYGYITQDNCWFREDLKLAQPKYDYNEAVVRYCLSYFVSLKSEQWKKTKPLSTVLPLTNGNSRKKMEEMFG